MWGERTRNLSDVPAVSRNVPTLAFGAQLIRWMPLSTGRQRVKTIGGRDVGSEGKIASLQSSQRRGRARLRRLLVEIVALACAVGAGDIFEDIKETLATSFPRTIARFEGKLSQCGPLVFTQPQDPASVSSHKPAARYQDVRHGLLCTQAKAGLRHMSPSKGHSKSDIEGTFGDIAFKSFGGPRSKADLGWSS